MCDLVQIHLVNINEVSKGDCWALAKVHSSFLCVHMLYNMFLNDISPE